MEGEAMKREILVRLDITGATDTHCGPCVEATRNCPWDQRRGWHMLEGYRRHRDCVRAEELTKESEGAKP